MTDQKLNLDELEALSAIATPAPWSAHHTMSQSAVYSPVLAADFITINNDGGDNGDEHKADAALIVAMRNSFGQLLAELREAQTQLALRQTTADAMTTLRAELVHVAAYQARIAELEAELREAHQAQAALAEKLGMVNEPCMGPTWPATWGEMLTRVDELREAQAAADNAAADRDMYKEHLRIADLAIRRMGGK